MMCIFVDWDAILWHLLRITLSTVLNFIGVFFIYIKEYILEICNLLLKKIKFVEEAFPS